ncbi:uncharacterized protein LOC134814657 [Bolinopsis microptera]|uniref:uncharacterized protein LOC134814657 n=1 Tax=Bolinopsis microptera TaxID=2820187 RepID=UPI00307AEFE5
MDKKKLKQLQSIIIKDLESLEDEAEKLKNPEGDDIDRVFQMLRLKLEERYKALKEQQIDGASHSSVINDLNRLKKEAMSSSASQGVLKGVHKAVNELKTTVLFASPPPKINTDSIISAIDHIGVESDSEDTDENIQLPDSPQDGDLYSSSPEDTVEPVVPFKSYSNNRQNSQSSAKKTSDSERSVQRSGDYGRAPTRNLSEERQEECDTRSFSSHHSSLQSSKRPDPTHKQVDLISPKDLLGPGAFIQPKTIELTDTSLTPDRKPQSQSRISMEVSRTPVREPLVPEYQPPERVAAVPPPGKGPVIQDLCWNKKIQRYFTESSEYSNPAKESWGSVEELYSPSQFFVKPKQADGKRDNVQIAVANYIHSSNLRINKSHSIGKMVLCQFVDGLWYRACVERTLAEHKYTVLFVDYGNRCEDVNYDKLRDMPDEILLMEPMCVQQCYLSGIMPPDRGQEWESSTVEALWDLVSNKMLIIRVLETTNQVYGVVLELQEGNLLININNKLVEMQLAIKYQVESTEPMKELCTSPTRFAPRSFPDTNPTSTAFQSTRSASPSTNPPPRRGRNRSPPPSTQRPHQGLTRTPLYPAQPLHPTHIPASTSHVARTPNNRHPVPSDDSEDDSFSPPSVGRPPSIGSGPQPVSRTINSPAPPFSFGDTSAKGRGNVFGNAPLGGDNFSAPDTGYEIPLDQGESSDPNKWKRDGFEDLDRNLPPPNFEISYRDLENTADGMSLSDRASSISPSTFGSEQRKVLKAKSAVKRNSSELIRGSKPDNTDPSDGLSPSDAKTPSSGIEVLSDDAENRDHTVDPGANSPKYEDMDRLEGDEGEEGEEGDDSNIPEPNDEQPPQSESLTAKLQEIIYDPKSYLLGDLTEESVYNNYKKGRLRDCKLRHFQRTPHSCQSWLPT